MDPTTKQTTQRRHPRRGEVAHVHIAKNGMLSAFDANGNDLKWLGGPSEEVLPLILKVSPDVPVTRED